MATAASKKKKPSKKALPSGKGLTFEKVWALMQEDAERLKEMERVFKERAELSEQEHEREHERERKERIEKDEQYEREKKKRDEQYERERKERIEQYEREKKERDEQYEREKLERINEHKKLDRIVRRNSKQMGELHRRFGQLAEHLVAPGITKRFNELGYHFDIVATKGAKIYDEKTGKVKTEIDLLMENGKTIMVVEVKSKPVIQDVEHHIKRLEILCDKRRTFLNDYRKVQGAIAGAIYEDDVKKAVREAGMYVIEQSGDTMKIDMPDGFIPREW